VTTSQITWQSPSNIALIKYWGKKGLQIPATPSLSMTLKRSHTTTSIFYQPLHKPGNRKIEFYLDNRRNEQFESKIRKYLDQIRGLVPATEMLDLIIHSGNSFPHSAGIASSASGMSALALCLNTIQQEESGGDFSSSEFFKETSSLARMGSGSASRSLYGGMTVWGKSEYVEDSSDNYAVPFNKNIHPDFDGLRDAILVISKKEKSVSSRAGHDLMKTNPFSKQRFIQARSNLSRIIKAMKSGNWDDFVLIVETEALSLHAMMMTSTPAYLLMQPETISVINKIRDFRQQTGHPVCFTLDAGPNIHLLYPASVQAEVKKFISTELLVYCDSGKWIDDEMGSGPIRLLNTK